MERKELIKKYKEFFEGKKHKEVVNAPLIPENDPTVLFTTAGMHPLVPFLLGQKHPQGKRLVSVQKCIRTGDIDSVGDDTHITFFEMLGNWSLGEYWKEEAIKMSYEFLTKELGIPIGKLAITCFKGEKENDIPRDEESAKIWEKLGVKKERIAYLGRENNWWGPAGKTGPCGPDTEMFYWSGMREAPEEFNPEDEKWVEIWNDVFMQYNKTEEGKYEPLKQKNVDTGMGVERTTAMINGRKSIWDNPDLKEIINSIGILGNSNMLEPRALKIIADHLRASVMILGEKVSPSNTEQGYVLRRLIRRAVRYGKNMGIKENFTKKIAEVIIDIYKEDYEHLRENEEFIKEEINKEEEKFAKTLEKGINLFNKVATERKKISGKEAFLLYQSYGFPVEMTEELAKEKGIIVDMKEYEKELLEHQEKSRTATAGKFKSGLADHSEMTTKYHTASHLLLEAMNRILGKEKPIEQRGSNINAERARFDFSYDRKLTDEEVREIELMVEGWISTGANVERIETNLEGARELGARGIFDDKYKGTISVYQVGEKGMISNEICTGPHVKTLKELQGYKIKLSEQKSVGSGIRRIKMKLEDRKE